MTVDFASNTPARECPNCGAEVRAGARFCRSCGMPVAPAMTIDDGIPPIKSIAADGDASPAFAVGAQPDRMAVLRQPWLMASLALVVLLCIGGLALKLTGKVTIGGRSPSGQSTQPSAQAADHQIGAGVIPSQSGPVATPSIASAQPPLPSARKLILSDANAKDIWSTSVYSYAPGGGGPGGGKEDERLRVGGYGDQYVVLIQFTDLPTDSRLPKAVWLSLYDNPDDGTPTPLTLQLIEGSWNWQRGDRLWWKDLPPVEPVQGRLIGAPTPGSWTRVNITDLYNTWKQNKRPNYGLMLRPMNSQNNYDNFSSTRAANRSHRPRLTILY
jgi:hypothetical protein